MAPAQLSFGLFQHPGHGSNACHLSPNQLIVPPIPKAPGTLVEIFLSDQDGVGHPGPSRWVLEVRDIPAHHQVSLGLTGHALSLWTEQPVEQYPGSAGMGRLSYGSYSGAAKSLALFHGNGPDGRSLGSKLAG